MLNEEKVNRGKTTREKTCPESFSESKNIEVKKKSNIFVTVMEKEVEILCLIGKNQHGKGNTNQKIEKDR